MHSARRLICVAFWSTVVMGFCIRAPNAVAQPVSISNRTTSVTAHGGQFGNGLVPYGGFFAYTDLATAEETTWSIDPLLIFPDGRTVVLSSESQGGFGAPQKKGNDAIRNQTVVNGIRVTADIELAKTNARTTFSFASQTKLDGVTFVFYAENDLFGHANDIAAFTGSIAEGDLKLFMFDSGAGGLSVRLTGEAGDGAELTLFGAGIWTGWGTALERGDLRGLSSDGANFQRVGDTGLALAFELRGNSASVIVNYDTQPMPPDVPETSYIAGYQPKMGAPRSAERGGQALRAGSGSDQLKRGRGQRGSEDAAKDLAAELLQAAEEPTRLGIIERLRDAKGGNYSEALAGAIPSLAGKTQGDARKALIDRFQRMTAATLRAKLSSQDVEVRLAAIRAAGLKRDESLIPDLIELLTHRHEETWESAAATLGGLTDQNLGPAADSNLAARFASQKRWKRWWARRAGASVPPASN